MVKIQDIARQMGLSTSTVYKAFNGGADINKNTRAEILKVAARMGYIGKPKNFPHKRVCVFLERMELQQVTYYLYEIALAFKRAAAQHGFEVVIRSLGDDVLGYDQIMRQYCLQGALILGLNTADQYYKQLERLEHPTVLVDNYIENPNISCISADNMRGMTLVVQHLLSLGHQRIGFINGEENSSTSAERLNGYVSAITLYAYAYTARRFFRGIRCALCACFGGTRRDGAALRQRPNGHRRHPAAAADGPACAGRHQCLRL